MSRYVGLHGHGISITMNEVNIPGPGRGEFMWLQREVECLRFIKLDKHNCQHLVLDFGVFKVEVKWLLIKIQGQQPEHNFDDLSTRP